VPDVPDIRPYLEIRTAGPGSFAPDGSSWLVSTNLTDTSQTYRQDTPGGPLIQLTAFPEPVGATHLPVETDDGPTLLVAMDDGGNERTQLYLAPADVSEPYTSADQLTPLVVDHDHIHRPGALSRDGRWLAYATNARNGTDFDVHVRDLTTGDDTVVWDRGGWNGAAGFSPDARILAISRLTEEAGDNEVWLLDRETGETWEVAPHDGPASVGGPSWLPDSSAFWFVTDVDREFTTVCRYDLATRSWEPADTATWDETDGDRGDWDHGAAVDWTGTHLLVTANVDGLTRAWLHDPVTAERRREVPLPGVGTAGGFRFSRDGAVLHYAFSSSRIPGDAFRYDVATGTTTRLTTSPCDVDDATFVDPELVRFPSFDGLEVPAFVFRPSGRAAGELGDDRRAPVVVMIHGGPESQYRPAFSGLTQYLVAQGFAVVAPNVRGSTGYGKTYEHLDDVHKRLDSVADLAALHDWLATQSDLDETRAALYGGSYGGYMVLAGLALQPERWAAGVDIVGISSLVTFLENTSPWRRRFREREYGSLEHDRDLLVAASPITHVEHMRAPLLIIHGANDPRVPLSEAEQIHEVLTERGVRCDLLVYADEGHGLAKLSNRIDAYPKVAAFLHDVLDA
jgi:dipeptidyl aminopeptidase/acylaminoacyl peptidase